MASEDLVCRRCSRPVRTSAAKYETFEGMHYVCFHYEFEHDPADPDEECTAGGCPSGAIAGGREAVAVSARRLAAVADSDAGWPNSDLPSFLAAFGAWLEDCGGYYANRRLVLPSNAWTIVGDACGRRPPTSNPERQRIHLCRPRRSRARLGGRRR